MKWVTTESTSTSVKNNLKLKRMEFLGSSLYVLYSESFESCSNTDWGGAQTCLSQQPLTVNTGRQGSPGGMCTLGDMCHMCMCRRPSDRVGGGG